MEEKQVQILIQKFLAGKASPEEINLIEAWYLAKQEEDVVWNLEDEHIHNLQDRMKSNIWANTVNKTSKKSRITLLTYLSVASAILIAAFIFYPRDSAKENYYSAAKAPVNQAENRHLTLPDSSIVILRPGSELLLAENFGAINREVQLIGEAYFDVRPNKSKPFIIQTGKIKTTVLGTAFSIQANPQTNLIEVRVDQGRVRVENEHELLGIITADQKLVISEPNQLINQTKAVLQVSKDEMQWKEQDMHFEAMPFGMIAEKLERRYQVKIDFLNAELEKCNMSGVFEGTDNLEEVLVNLCMTSNTTFTKVAENQYQIIGESCFNK